MNPNDIKKSLFDTLKHSSGYDLREQGVFSVGVSEGTVEAMARAILNLVQPIPIGTIVRHKVMGVRGIIRDHDEGWAKVEWADGSAASARYSSLEVWPHDNG